MTNNYCPAYAPNGLPILGTMERVPARAEIDGFRRNEDGELEFNYAGGTEVFWDNQETVTSPDDQLLFLDADGTEWKETEIFLLSDASQWLADHEYKHGTWTDFVASSPLPALLKRAAEAHHSGPTYVVWDPRDDEDGYLLVGDDAEDMIVEAYIHLKETAS